MCTRDADPVTAAAAIETGSDGHVVIGLPGCAGDVPLVDALRWLEGAGAARLTFALPVPADPLGVAHPGDFGTAATEAGAGIIATTHRAGTFGWVPVLDERGSSYRGWRWRLFATETPSAAQLPEEPLRLLDQADRQLRRALRAATDTLAAADLTRWRAEATSGRAAAAAALERHLGPWPARWPPAARALSEQAFALLHVLGVAEQDTGGASASVQRKRGEVLRELSRAVRAAAIVSFDVPAAAALRSAPQVGHGEHR